MVAVGRSEQHDFSKQSLSSIDLVQGLGVLGDCHNGVTVQHRSRLKIKPPPANLRQVHIIHSELFDEMREAGHDVKPQDLGENVTTRILRFGDQATVEITGLRNPCDQIENFQAGLQAKMLVRDAGGKLVRKTGVMGIVKEGGVIDVGCQIVVQMPAEPHKPLRVV